MQPIVHIKDGLWGNLALMAFCLGLAAFAVWIDYKFHGEVSVYVWAFSAFFVLFCFVPISAIRRPRSRLLAIDGCHLLWRIYDPKTGQAAMECRLALHSIRALNWGFPKYEKWSGTETPSISGPSLVFITAERSSHTLPSEFFPASYRRRIEAVMKEKIPGLKIVEKHEFHD
jgi:hypothetical protein